MHIILYPLILLQILMKSQLTAATWSCIFYGGLQVRCTFKICCRSSYKHFVLRKVYFSFRCHRLLSGSRTTGCIHMCAEGTISTNRQRHVEFSAMSCLLWKVASACWCFYLLQLFAAASRFHALLLLVFQTLFNSVLMFRLIWKSNIALLLSFICLPLKSLSEKFPRVANYFFLWSL